MYRDVRTAHALPPSRQEQYKYILIKHPPEKGKKKGGKGKQASLVLMEKRAEQGLRVVMHEI